MAWLGTYAKRIKVTISNTNIDTANLTHFPLLLTLGTSVGTGSTDVSCVFDELTSDANRKKIAITKTDGTTQLYGEIEKWDDANEKAWIWVSKSDFVIAYNATTDVYLYYDSAQSDNTTYIGDTNDVVAESVWDSSYKMVQHLPDGASTSATYDSTSNDNDGVKGGAGEPAVVTTGEIANAQNFDGTDDTIAIADAVELNVEDDFTIQGWINADAIDRYNTILGKATGGGVGYYIYIHMNNRPTLQWYDHNSGSDSISSDDSIEADSWYYIVATWDGTYGKVYVDGVLKKTADETATPIAANAYDWAIGTRGTGSIPFDGKIDEIRISNTARSLAWIKADYYCETDGLVSWGSEETSGINTQINISDAWKEASEMKINIGDSWKDVTKVQQNIGDDWKDVF